MLNAGSAVETRLAARRTGLRRALPIVLSIVDAFLIYMAIVMAYWLRYKLELGPAIHDHIPFSQYVPVAFLLLAIMLPVLAVKGAYQLRLSTDFVDEFALIFSAATITVASIVVVTSMLHQYEYSRGVIVYLWVLVIVLVLAGRALFHFAQSMAHRRGWGVSRALVVGASNVSKMVMQNITNRPDLGYSLVGFVDHKKGTIIQDFGRFRALGTTADIPGLIAGGGIDEVIITLPASAHEEVWPILALCEQHGVGLKIVPDLFEMSLSRVQVDDIAGIPLLDVRERPLERVGRVAKRGIDLSVAAFLLVATLPLVALLAILIRMESPGPALISQERVGLNGKRFRCHKLRTMRADAEQLQSVLRALNEQEGPLFKMRDDPRHTRVGRVIRRWSLDELPQMLNVVRGEMSLVGPRPPLPSEVAEYEPHHLRRLETKPGLTGMWQVSGRSEISFDEMVMMDTFYVDNWSLALDIRILIRTVIAVLGRQGAY